MSQSMPSVAILIPTYKQSAWIGRAVASALQQDYPHKTIWVMDDASPDDTADVLHEWISSGAIRYDRAPNNIGRVANYRRGLEAAVGADWVINLDGDDYFTEPTFIRMAIDRVLSVGQESVLFYQGINLYGPDEAHARRLEPRMDEEERVIPARDYLLDYFKRNAFSHLATLYRRDLALDLGFYQKDILSTDLDSILRLCIAHPNKLVMVGKRVAGLWVQHPDNASRVASWSTLWQNQQLYPELARRMLELGWNKTAVLRWRNQSYLHFARMFVGNQLRNWGWRR
jgi:glycosyltransferase involved in cell wall biosynthesis